MNRNDYVSIVMPTYNRAKTIKNSLMSIINQTYQNFEIVVVDDCSTDDTQSVIESLDDRIKYVRLDSNHGPSYARNEGVKHATYDLIAFNDSDDVWRANKLEKQMEKMAESPEYSLVYCAYEYKGPNGVMRFPNNVAREELEGRITKSIIKKNTIGTPTVLVKKECFLSVGGFDTNLKSLEDWEFAIRFSKKYCVGYVDEVLVDASFSVGGVNSQDAKKAFTCSKILEENGKEQYDLTNVKMGLVSCLGAMNKEELNSFFEMQSFEEDYDKYLVLSAVAKSSRKKTSQLDAIEMITNRNILHGFLDANDCNPGKTIGIYGAGYVGKILGRSLKSMGYCDICYWDRSISEVDGQNVCNPDDIIKKANVVIVTVGENISVAEFGKYSSDKVINIFDILK